LSTLATRALVATTAIQVAAACAALTVPSIAPVIAARLDVPASMVGTYLSLLYAGASTAALAGGGVVLRFGAVRLSQACLVACAVGLALTLLLCVSAGAMGLFSIAVAAVVVGWVTGHHAGLQSRAGENHAARTHGADVLHQADRRAGRHGAGGSGRTAVDRGFWLGGRRTPGRPRMRRRALLAQPLRAPLDEDRDRTARLSPATLVNSLALVARSPGLRTMALVSFVYAGMQMSVSGFIVAYLHTEIGLGLVAAGTVLTAANVAGVVARISWARCPTAPERREPRLR